MTQPEHESAEELLERATDVAFAELEKVDGDPERLAVPHRVLVILTSAQGVLDDGGLRYFFSNDWPGQPPYRVFAEAYRAIGARPEADAIEAAAASFELPDAERQEERRCERMEGALGERLAALDDTMKNDVWALLAEYVRANGDAF